jgi:hypothetical protein
MTTYTTNGLSPNPESDGRDPAVGPDPAIPATTAPYPPTGTFPGHYAGPQQPHPQSFEVPGYGYAYPSTPNRPSGFRLEPPAAWPIAVFTFLFGILGAISAARRSSDARALGLPVGRYWGVFAGSLVGSIAAWTLVVGVLVAVFVPLYQSYKSTVITVAGLEQELRSSNASGVAVTAATCIEDSVTSAGVGTYLCQLGFADGEAASYTIAVNDDGTWAATTY